MPPKYTTQKSDDETASVDSDSASVEQSLPPPSSSANKSTFKLRKARNLTKISAAYDLDGDGILDEAEQAMRDRDVNDNGFLSNEEIYDIVQAQLKAKKSAGYMKKLIMGLVCFVVILALSNLGTSLAAAFLAKDLNADNGGGAAVEEGEEPPVPAMRIAATGEIAGAQSIADTYVMMEEDELSDEELDERRRLVLEDLEDDPHSHPHRRLACNSRSRSVGCSGRITMDNQVMKEEDFFKLESKCKRQQNVYIKQKRGDTERNDCLCKRGTSVVVKEKGTKKIGRNKNGNNNKNKDKNKDKNNKVVKVGRGKKPRKQKGKNRLVIIENEDGDSAHWDCEDGYCHGGGSLLQGELNDVCRIRGDECRSSYVCERTNKNVRSSSNSKYGRCAKPTKKSMVVVQRQTNKGYRGDYCDIDLRNQCDVGLWCEPDDFDNVVNQMRGRSGNGANGGWTGVGGVACGQGVVIAGPSGTIDTRQEGCKGTPNGNNGAPRSARSGSQSGVGTCQRNAGSGQTCYDDWQCASGQCDGLGARNGNGGNGGNNNQGAVISGPSGTIVANQWNGGSASNTGICY